MKKIFLIIVLVILVFILGFSLSQNLERIDLDTINFVSKDIPDSKNDIVNDCKNLGLEETADCLRDNIKTFYKYTITDDALSLSFEEIKEKGGDCRNYAFLYEALGTDLGFDSSTIAYKGIYGVSPSHRFGIIWDDEKYCKLNLLNVECRDRING